MRFFLAVSLLLLLALLLYNGGVVEDDNKKADNGMIFQGYGKELGNTYLTREARNKDNQDIAPWLATYEGQSIEERQFHRHRILNQVCNSTGHTRIEEFPRQILVNDQNKLLFCYIERAGSATLLKTVLEANRLTLGLPKGDFNVHDLSELERYGIKRLNTYSKEEQEDILRTHFKFLFVRHPLSRLRSAHRMFTEGVKKKHKNSKRPTLKVTAGLLKGRNWKREGFPPFNTFIHLISSKWKEVKETQTARFNNFEDSCLPCDIHYDFIGKHEYFADELNYVLKNRLPNAQPITSDITKTGWIDLDKVYSNFTKETSDLFLQRYGNDFRLFNYEYLL